MAWITRLKMRLGIGSPKRNSLSPQRYPARETFRPTCPLRPAMEPTLPCNQAAYLESQGNRPAIIDRFNRILKMDTVLVELGCGNAEMAWQIASRNPALGVIATDIYRSPCLTGSSSGYSKASRAWTNGLLKAQMFAPDNLVILRAGACILRFLPAGSIDTILLVNPEPAMGRAFLELLAETPISCAVRPGSHQLVIKPFSKKMGVATCGGYEFETEKDWSRGIGFMRDSPFVFTDAPRIQWNVDLGAFSDYSKNSTQTGVSVCGNIGLPSGTVEAVILKALSTDTPTRRPGSI